MVRSRMEFVRRLALVSSILVVVLYSGVLATPPSLPKPPITVELTGPQHELAAGDTFVVALRIMATGPIHHSTGLPDKIYLALRPGLKLISGEAVFATLIDEGFDSTVSFTLEAITPGHHFIDAYVGVDRWDSVEYKSRPFRRQTFRRTASGGLSLQVVAPTSDSVQERGVSGGPTIELKSAEDLNIPTPTLPAQPARDEGPSDREAPAAQPQGRDSSSTSEGTPPRD